MPLLWHDEVVGWINLAAPNGRIDFKVGYAKSTPKGRAFRQAFDLEMSRMEAFLTRITGPGLKG